MRLYISLPWKILTLLLTVLMILGISISMLWIDQTEQDFTFRQQQIKQQNRQQYHLLNQILSDRIESWVESFVHLNDLQEDSLQSMGEGLAREIDFLRLNWTVSDVWLFDQENTPLFTSDINIPPEVIEQAVNADVQQRPMSNVVCDETCVHIISLPILTNQGDTATLVISASLLETLALLHRSSQALLAQVNHPAKDWSEPANQLQINGEIAPEQQQSMQQLLNAISREVNLVSLFNNGAQVTFEGVEYLLTLIAVQPDREDHNFILLAHDISAITQTHNTYRSRVTNLVAVTFCLTGLLFFFLTNSFRRRLVYLSKRLPLLAKQQYHQFKRGRTLFPHFMNDELDTLMESANQLSEQLESLDKRTKEQTDQLEKIAMYDGLTKLPNRNMLAFQLDKAIADLARNRGIVVLLFLDLDDFKKVNDSHGHNIGDALLVEAANRLSFILRKTDIACRFGGDEFVILMRHFKNTEQVEGVAHKLLEQFKRPVLVDDLRFYVSTSIGIASTSSSDCNPNDLIRHADIAMYEAKQVGGSCYRVFDTHMSKKVQRQVDLEDEARTALAENHFKLALQPQVAIKNNKLIGFEALLRWEHPTRGIIAPGEFIPILENTEFIIEIGYWCIERSLDILTELDEAGLKGLRIAINLSAAQFLDPNLVPFLTAKVIATGHKAEDIELELTERTLVNDIDKAMEVMQSLNDMGFAISIDDFGTGYSSLSYLKSMPLDQVKIDQSFISGMLHSSADKQIVLSTISMVHNLGMEVVAEGIEHEEQMEMLKEFKCDYAQGYLIAKPIIEDELLFTVQRELDGRKWTMFKTVEELSKAN